MPEQTAIQPLSVDHALPMLQLSSVDAGYGRLRVLHDVDLTVQPGEVVTVVGPNGAGKTTLLRSVVGHADVTSGDVSIAGQPGRAMSPADLRRAGLGYVPQGRHLFPNLSVENNLRLGVLTVPRAERAACLREQLELVCNLFPAIPTFLNRAARTLSGGQQQMVALARALMSKPRLLLLDEPSMGLAPAPLRMILGAVAELREQGVGTLLVEQLATVSLRVADRAYVLRGGKVADDGDAASFRDEPERLRAAYFGAS